jgi:dienelactone hydrolase
LQQHPTVEPTKIAAIGYCFGGGIILHMAETGIDLAGVVSFHGSLALKTPDKSGKIKAKILVLNGADDPFVTVDQIASFKQDMKKVSADYEFVNYPGGHMASLTQKLTTMPSVSKCHWLIMRKQILNRGSICNCF